MKTTRLIALLTFLVPLASFANVISITNGDFEAPLILDQADSVRGPYSFSAVGWDIDIARRAGTYLPTAVAYPASIVDGRIGWSNGGTFSQLTAATFQAGYEYSLSVDVGYRLDAGLPAGRIGIFAGDISNVVAFLTLASQGRGQFYTGQVSATEMDYSAFIGQDIGVFMRANGVQINFDNVSLTGRSTANQVSEPGTLMLFGLSLTLVTGLTRRRRG